MLRTIKLILGAWLPKSGSATAQMENCSHHLTVTKDKLGRVTVYLDGHSILGF